MVQIERVYEAGVCNISKEEEALRLSAGWIGVVVTVLAEAAFVWFGVPAAWRLTLFLPATMAASGFLQAGFHFCARFGMAGVFNLGATVGATQKVEQDEFIKKDRAKAQLILGLSFLIGAAAAAVGYFIA